MIIQRAADISAKDEAERQAKLIDDGGYKQLGYQTDHAGARSYTGTQASSNPQVSAHNCTGGTVQTALARARARARGVEAGLCGCGA